MRAHTKTHRPRLQSKHTCQHHSCFVQAGTSAKQHSFSLRNNHSCLKCDFSLKTSGVKLRRGSVCEFSSAGPPALKSLQRPVSWTAHFNASVSGLGEGWPPLRGAHCHPPGQPHPLDTTLNHTLSFNQTFYDYVTFFFFLRYAAF